MTSAGLLNLGQLNPEFLRLSGLPANSISGSVLGGLETDCKLQTLVLGGNNRNLSVEGIPAAAVVRYVSLYGHTGSYTGPDVDRLTHSHHRQ